MNKKQTRKLVLSFKQPDQSLRRVPESTSFVSADNKQLCKESIQNCTFWHFVAHSLLQKPVICFHFFSPVYRKSSLTGIKYANKVLLKEVSAKNILANIGIVCSCVLKNFEEIRSVEDKRNGRSKNPKHLEQLNSTLKALTS